MRVARTHAMKNSDGWRHHAAEAEHRRSGLSTKRSYIRGPIDMFHRRSSAAETRILVGARHEGPCAITCTRIVEQLIY
jgi:hypothetical protein